MDTKRLKEIIQIFENSQITSMDLEVENMKLKLEKNATLVREVVLEDKVEPIVEEAKDYVKAPLVGTFYAAPAVGSDPFVRVGQQVHTGDTLCIIEAMKVMNEIKAPKSGCIIDIKVKNGDTVQFGDDLMAIGEAYDS